MDGQIRIAELLPCPFCGKSLTPIDVLQSTERAWLPIHEVKPEHNPKNEFEITCDGIKDGIDCNCTMSADSWDKLKAMWNRRP